MINYLIYIIFSKEIVLYDKHRHVDPLINSANKKQFVFISMKYLWLSMTIFGKKKLRNRAMFVLINIINPKYIISMNWITKRHCLYYLWVKKKGKDFIVVQHGSYVGGRIFDIAHRYSKCTIMYCWSNYFKETFKNYNRDKNVTFVNYGNTIYNKINRQKLHYESGPIKNILFLPTFMQDEIVIKEFKEFVNRLSSLGCRVDVKQHNYQGKFKALNGLKVVKESIYELLLNKNYDLVISDYSSSLLDAIFFKKKVLYYNCSNYHKDNEYNNYLTNIGEIKPIDITINSLKSLIDIRKQEMLFERLAGGFTENNIINI